MTAKKKQTGKRVASNDGLADLTADAVLGITLALVYGINPPRWMCMSNEAKAKYITDGIDAVERFKADERTCEEARKARNPRGFFVR